MSPEEIQKTKQHFLKTMSGAMDYVLSDANPYFRAAQRAEAGEDAIHAIADELYGESESVEASGWLQEGARGKQKRFLHTYSPRKSRALVDELYAAGACQVSVAAIESSGSLQCSDVIIVTLPADPAQRRALAAIHEREMAKVWCYEPSQSVPLPQGKTLLFQYT